MNERLTVSDGGSEVATTPCAPSMPEKSAAGENAALDAEVGEQGLSVWFWVIAKRGSVTSSDSPSSSAAVIASASAGPESWARPP